MNFFEHLSPIFASFDTRVEKSENRTAQRRE